MTTRKTAWIDPFLEAIAVNTKEHFPVLIDYLDLLIQYFFKLVIMIVVLRVYHLRLNDNIPQAKAIVDEFNQDLWEPSVDTLTPNQQIQALVAQCLAIVPLTETTIWQLRQVSFADRKNVYRRMRDAIEVMGEIQLLLLALAYADDEYEEFFALDLSLPLDLSAEES
jgi:hypothetical protein